VDPAVLTIPIVYLSGHFQDWFGYQAVEFPGDGAVTPVAATLLFGYAGMVFLRGARGELRDRRPGMMTLISLAITWPTATACDDLRPRRRAALLGVGDLVT
jgi:Cu2+-exporting ATPase